MIFRANDDRTFRSPQLSGQLEELIAVRNPDRDQEIYKLDKDLANVLEQILTASDISGNVVPQQALSCANWRVSPLRTIRSSFD